MIFPHKIKPLFFAKYIKSLYDQWMDIREANCIDYYRVVDYLQDEITLSSITNFMNLNLAFENSIDILALTNKFDEAINKFYSETDVNSQEINTLINYVKKLTNHTTQPATLIKIIQNLNKKSSSSICADILRVYLSTIGWSGIDVPF